MSRTRGTRGARAAANDAWRTPTRSPAPWYPGKDDESKGAALSPAGSHLLLRVAPAKREKGRRDLMPVWISEDGDVGERHVRAKVGPSERSAERLLLLDLERGERIEVELSELPGRRDDPLRELREARRAADAVARPLTDSRREAFLSSALTAQRRVTVSSSRGAGRMHARLYAPGGAPPPGGFPAVVFIHGAGYLQNAHQGWSKYEREFLFHPQLVARGFVCPRRGLARLRRLRPASADGDLPGHEAPRARGPARRRRVAGRAPERRPEAPRLLRRLVRRLPHPHGAVPRARPLRGRSGAAAGHRLVASRPLLHQQHPQHPRARPGGVPAQLTHRVRRGARQAAPHLRPDAGRQRARPRHRPPGPAPHRARQDRALETAIHPAERHGFKEPPNWRDEYARILSLFEEHLR